MMSWHAYYWMRFLYALSFWRRWLVGLAFHYPHTGTFSKLCWRASRIFASERAHMNLAMYCAGHVMQARMVGKYDDPDPADITETFQ